MQYYSTRNKSLCANFSTAVLSGLAGDGGLFVPQEIPSYPSTVLASLESMPFCDIAVETIRPFVGGEIPPSVLGDIVSSAYTFDAPLVKVGGMYVLELFHGPTAAFKDFGARFMARAFSYLRRGESRPLKILVATSGDTGGAVADGFFGVEGISVTVLYPKGRVSPLQECQIAGLGNNISAIAVEGSFDDCQRLVKAAFGNDALKKRLDLSSANSINIARLIPQAIYYTAASVSKSLNERGQPIVCCVPSGNFGNLTAGMYAQKMGAPIREFIAATNINKTFPCYLESGSYQARDSMPTISNAMDVGAPSNFERMCAHWTLDEMQKLILSTYINDDDTRNTIKNVYGKYAYILDPHTAVAWCAACNLKEKLKDKNAPIAVLSTAHPAKFSDTVEPLTEKIPLPQSLQKAMQRKVVSKTIPANLDALLALL
ncbi:MAG: threonine synthase [Termitinemataceae bacterium]|nr:MAG: threonine synthase [Termitinemataceae bacterium]